MEQQPTQAEGTTRRSLLVRGAALGATIGAGGLLAEASPAFAHHHGHHGLTRKDADDSPLPGGGRDHRNRSVAAVQRARRHPGQRSPRRNREPGLPRRRRGPGRGHGPVHPRQHRRRDQPPHVPQRLPQGARRGNGQPGRVPHPAEQQGDRRAADRTADQPDAADRQHQLLDPLPQRLAEPRLRRHPSASRPGPRRRSASGDPPRRRRPDAQEAPPGDRQHGGVPFRVGRARRHQPLRGDSRSGSPTRRCCASCSASAAARSMHFQTWQDKAGNAPAADRPHDRVGVPRPQRRRRTDSRPT